MAEDARPLAPGDTGAYAEIVARPLPEGLVLLFMPSLAALAGRAEQLKGAPLTREELLRIRDRAAVLVSEPEPARAVEERSPVAEAGCLGRGRNDRCRGNRVAAGVEAVS
jgi:hypothetical protein